MIVLAGFVFLFTSNPWTSASLTFDRGTLLLFTLAVFVGGLVTATGIFGLSGMNRPVPWPRQHNRGASSEL